MANHEKYDTLQENSVQSADDRVDTFAENHEHDVDMHRHCVIDSDVIAKETVGGIQNSKPQRVVEGICLEDKPEIQNDENVYVVEGHLESRFSDNVDTVVECTSGSRNDENNDVPEDYLIFRNGDNHDIVENNIGSRITDNDDVAEDNIGSRNGDNDGAAENIFVNRNADNDDVVDSNLESINREPGDVVDDNLENINSEHDDDVDNVETRTGDNEAVVEAVSQTNAESEISTEHKDESLRVKEAWNPDEIQSLLIKAINFRASIKDIKTIIMCGGEVNRPMNNGLHPLHYAAYTDNIECVELLLNHGANVNVTDDIGYTPIHLTARRGNYK